MRRTIAGLAVVVMVILILASYLLAGIYFVERGRSELRAPDTVDATAVWAGAELGFAPARGLHLVSASSQPSSRRHGLPSTPSFSSAI